MRRLERTNKKFTFGGHNTFPLRFTWFPKAIRGIRDNHNLLKDANRENAMQRLGLGSNMVVALKYWLEVTELVGFDEQGSSISPLGMTLLGEQGDPFLEDEVTLWVLHWLISSNAELATGFFWFFNEFVNPRCDEAVAVKALQDFNQHQLGIQRSESTLKSEVSTLLRMYALSRRKQAQNDENLDSPFISLNLISADATGYNSVRMVRPLLPEVVIHFVLQTMAQQRQLKVFPVRELLHKSAGWPNLGGVFRLDESGLMDVLQRLINTYPAYYELSDTAGLNQLSIKKIIPNPEDVLRDYYQKARGGK